MNLIGNDIMLLNDDNLQTFFRKRARNYVLSDVEKKWYSETCSAKNLIWRWTCKEAAYKIAIKNGFPNAFAPSFFTVLSKCEPEENEQITGIVSFLNSFMFFHSTITHQYIHTIAWDSVECNLNSLKKQIWHSDKEYSSVIESLTGKSTLKIVKNEIGIPQLYSSKGIRLNKEISISNDHETKAIVIGL